MDLISLMLQFDPKQRLSLAELKAHAWYNLDTFDEQQTFQQFIDRKKVIDQCSEEAKHVN